MFEAIRIKLHSLLIKKKKEPAFVNPYAPPGVSAQTPPINPYAIDYGTDKKKTMKELIVGFVKKEKKPEVPDFTIGLKRKVVEEPARVVTSITTLNKIPSLSWYIKTIVSDDIDYIASILRHPTCRTCNERHMTDIERVCESFKCAQR